MKTHEKQREKRLGTRAFLRPQVQCAFPDFRSFAQIFDASSPRDDVPHATWKVSGPSTRFRPIDIQIGPELRVVWPGDRSKTIYVVPNRKVFSDIERNTLVVERDRLAFTILVSDASTAIVLVEQHEVRSSRWLARIDPATIPSFAR